MSRSKLIVELIELIVVALLAIIVATYNSETAQPLVLALSVFAIMGLITIKIIT